MAQRKRSGSGKPPVGAKIIGRLREFTEAVEQGKSVEERYTITKFAVRQPSAYGPKRVRETRELLGASQNFFAGFLGVAVGTVRAWEQGTNVPSDIASRFMDEIHHNPDYWKQRVREVAVRTQDVRN